MVYYINIEGNKEKRKFEGCNFLIRFKVAHDLEEKIWSAKYSSILLYSVEQIRSIFFEEKLDFHVSF